MVTHAVLSPNGISLLMYSSIYKHLKAKLLSVLSVNLGLVYREKEREKDDC